MDEVQLRHACVTIRSFEAQLRKATATILNDISAASGDTGKQLQLLVQQQQQQQRRPSTPQALMPPTTFPSGIQSSTLDIREYKVLYVLCSVLVKSSEN